jgi:hypothetical protein
VPNFVFYCSDCGKPQIFWQSKVDPKFLKWEKEELAAQNIALKNLCSSLSQRLEEAEAIATPFGSSGQSIADWLDSH